MRHMDTWESISRGGGKCKGPGAGRYLKGARKPVLSQVGEGEGQQELSVYVPLPTSYVKTLMVGRVR